ncbi:MAG TPA: homoserine kinase [Mycobacteriales bacterium]|nr:homoserine kinase [Mycobacteriales bacterium]
MPSFRAAPVRVRVPATSANLGPAFDSAGLALALYDDVVVRVADRGLVVDVAGEGSDNLPRDKRHLVVKSLRAAFDLLGGQPRGLEVVCANRIPQARGLGSSSAAIVAAVVAARALVLGGEDALDTDASLRLATELEGHPDNVAACLYGGLTFAWTGETGVQVRRVDVHPSVCPVAFVPSTRASTKKVRGMLPESVSHADAAANSARAALLALGLTRDPSVLLDATEDRLHQEYRAPAMPRSASLVRKLRAAGVPAVISGAGPTVLALASQGTQDEVAAQVPRGWEALPLAVEPAGAVVVPL